MLYLLKHCCVAVLRLYSYNTCSNSIGRHICGAYEFLMSYMQIYHQMVEQDNFDKPVKKYPPECVDFNIKDIF